MKDRFIIQEEKHRNVREYSILDIGSDGSHIDDPRFICQVAELITAHKIASLLNSHEVGCYTYRCKCDLIEKDNRDYYKGVDNSKSIPDNVKWTLSMTEEEFKGENEGFNVQLIVGAYFKGYISLDEAKEMGIEIKSKK